MQSFVSHPVYGNILYEESAWTGKKSLTVNGISARKEKKNLFLLPPEMGLPPLHINGSYIGGTKLQIGNEIIQLTPPVKWYEVACSVFMVVFLIVWSTSVTLCSILPIIGGALGGAIFGVMGWLNVLWMKSFKKIWQKLLVFLAVFFLTVIIGTSLGFTFLLILS